MTKNRYVERGISWETKRVVINLQNSKANALHFVAMAKFIWCAFQSHVATAQRALLVGSSCLVWKVAHLELKTADLFKDYIFTHRMVWGVFPKDGWNSKFETRANWKMCKGSLIQACLICFLPFLRQDELVQKQTSLLSQAGSQIR